MAVFQAKLSVMSVFASIACLTLVHGFGSSDVCSRERNGNIVIQAEDTKLTSGWVRGREVDGYTGRGYITWSANNQYRFEGKGILKYNICVTGGTYAVNFWSMRLEADLRDDEGNDAWVKTGQEWIKLFTGFGTKMNIWQLSSRFDYPNGRKGPPLIELDAGCQVFQIAGRSEMYSLDRLILVKTGSELDMDMGVTSCNAANESAQRPLCNQSLVAARVPERSTRISVTFTNESGQRIRIFKRSQTGNLVRVEGARYLAPGRSTMIKTALYNRFAATTADGSCLENELIVGVTGRLRNRKTTFIIA